MGIFRRKNKEKQEQYYNYDMELNREERVHIYDVHKIENIKYPEGYTNLMLGKIIRYNKKDAIDLDIGEYVTFEVKDGQYVTNTNLREVIMKYIEQKSQQESAKCMYLGRFEKGVRLGEKSENVEAYVQGYVTRQIEEQKRQREEQEKQQRDLSRKKDDIRARVNAQEHLKHIEEMKQYRLAHPEMTKLPSIEQNGKILENYRGVNLNTGDVLRLTNVDKVGKDGAGTYLYKANLNFTSNLDDVEVLANNMSNVVCFETDKRISDMVEEQNGDEISSILKFLSEYNSVENAKKFSYLGKICSNGEIEKKEKSDSLAIAKKVEELEQEYQASQIRDKENRQV